MSWGYYTERKCEKCQNEYLVEESTLTNLTSNYDKCPKCGGEGKIISTESATDEVDRMIEVLKNRESK